MINQNSFFHHKKEGFSLHTGYEEKLIPNYKNIKRHLSPEKYTQRDYTKMKNCDEDVISYLVSKKNRRIFYEEKLSAYSTPSDPSKYLKITANFSGTIPDHITHVEFDDDFDSDIIIPNSVVFLKTGRQFDRQIIIPAFVKCLILGGYFNQLIVLPNSIEFIDFGPYFNQHVILPALVEYVKFWHLFDQEIILPNFIKYLEFGDKFNRKVILPDSLMYLFFGYRFNQSIELPNFLRFLVFSTNFNQSIKLPDSLKYLELGDDFDQNIILPKNLQYFEFFRKLIRNKDGSSVMVNSRDPKKRSIFIPGPITHLNFGDFFNTPTIPDSATHLNFGESFYKNETILFPDSEKYLRGEDEKEKHLNKIIVHSNIIEIVLLQNTVPILFMDKNNELCFEYSL